MCPVVGLLGYIVVLFLDYFLRNLHIVHNGDADIENRLLNRAEEEESGTS